MRSSVDEPLPSRKYTVLSRNAHCTAKVLRQQFIPVATGYWHPHARPCVGRQLERSPFYVAPPEYLYLNRYTSFARKRAFPRNNTSRILLPWSNGATSEPPRPVRGHAKILNSGLSRESYSLASSVIVRSFDELLSMVIPHLAQCHRLKFSLLHNIIVSQSFHCQ